MLLKGFEQKRAVLNLEITLLHCGEWVWIGKGDAGKALLVDASECLD